MDSQTFDRLARIIGQPASRRRALAGLVGAALAGVASTTEAKHRQHRHHQGHAATRMSAQDCAKFCTSVFPPGPQRGQCVSDAAHGKGLCPLCKADPSNLCGTTCCQPPDTCGGGGTSGVCGHCTPTCAVGVCGNDDGCGGTCHCSNGQTCLDNGTCVLPCPRGFIDCPSGCQACLLMGSGGVTVCATGGTHGGCSNPSDPASCQQGEFCWNAGFCVTACIS